MTGLKSFELTSEGFKVIRMNLSLREPFFSLKNIWLLIFLIIPSKNTKIKINGVFIIEKGDQDNFHTLFALVVVLTVVIVSVGNGDETIITRSPSNRDYDYNYTLR
ncbi:hypothetical protein BpHYR1_041086 [Brachionus plicatilis]|uniref:Uncharacterized protein n=1 Tax=Brachionus plicatilis TaxID=10195 RepID=A0A3M7R5S0_BRAPC|nr:hypothetical protein BpHYR1_041086 [Brachionus plicatilis]